MVYFYTNAFATYMLESSRTSQHRPVAWPRPNNDIVCLNVDESICWVRYKRQVLEDSIATIQVFGIMVVLHGLE
jgi:hypothetical protein